MAEFKDRLKELRVSKGISQQDLADHLGVHKMTISGYERGVRRPNFEILDRLAAYLNTSFDYLFGVSDKNSHYPYSGGYLLYDDSLHVFGPKPLPDHLRDLVSAYEDASPDTQAAVRAILHLDGSSGSAG